MYIHTYIHTCVKIQDIYYKIRLYIPFISDYMKSIGVAGAYPKVTVDGQHRFLGVCIKFCVIASISSYNLGLRLTNM